MSVGPYREPQRELVPPPREVPRSVRRRLLFGGFLSIFGWAWCSFWLLLGGIFVSLADVSSLWQFAGAVQTAQGTVVASQGTNSRENGVRIRAIDYVFKDESGAERRCTSYEVGTSLRPGQTVEVEYPDGKPGRSRIAGLRRSVFPNWVGLFILGSLVGILMALRGIVVGRRAVRLLRHGRVGWGKLVRKRATNVRINNQPVYALTFEFEVDGRPYHVAARTHRPEVLEDERKEQLLYDPSDPRRATLVDHLPGAPRVDNRGHIAEGSRLLAALVLALPLLSLGIFICLLIVNIIH